VRVGARADATKEVLALRLVNTVAGARTVQVRDAAYGAVAQTITLAASAALQVEWSVAKSGHWYDIIVDGPGDDWTRLAGHVETRTPSMSDPAAIAPVLTL
jgi:phospholipase C